MNGVIAMSELLASMKLDEEQQDIVNTIRTSGTAMMTLIDDLLTFSKIEAGKFHLSPQLFKLETLLRDVGNVFRLRCAQKSLQWSCYPHSDLPLTRHCLRRPLSA